jgi:hypothetical protein
VQPAERVQLGAATDEHITTGRRHDQGPDHPSDYTVPTGCRRFLMDSSSCPHPSGRSRLYGPRMRRTERGAQPWAR